MKMKFWSNLYERFSPKIYSYTVYILIWVKKTMFSNFWFATLSPFYPHALESGKIGMECLLFEKKLYLREGTLSM